MRKPAHVPAAWQHARRCAAWLAHHEHRKRAVFAFDVAGDLVFIIGVFYGGQDYESILNDDADD